MSLAVKSETRTARKRCAKCGKAGWYRPRVRHCRYIDRLFKGTYLCYGALTPIMREGATVVKSPQAVAQQKLDQARAQVTKKTRALKRLATSLRFWENRCRYFAARASLTDMELAVEKQKRAEQTARRRAERVRRGINLKEVV